MVPEIEQDLREPGYDRRCEPGSIEPVHEGDEELKLEAELEIGGMTIRRRVEPAPCRELFDRGRDDPTSAHRFPRGCAATIGRGGSGPRGSAASRARN